jgi:hypothetical protein
VIRFDEKIVALWFVATIPDEQDWMAAIRELVPDEKYELVYRFRYYKDDKAFDSEDKRSWYRAELTGTRNYVLLTFRNLAERLHLASSGPLYEVLNDKGMDDFLRRFQDMPFVHARMLSKGEASAYVDDEPEIGERSHS